MANTFLQVRVDEKDKEQAARILDSLGTNLSTVVNMLIKQIIITESIPFDVKLNAGHKNCAQAQSLAYEEAVEAAVQNPDAIIQGIREEYDQ